MVVVLPAPSGPTRPKISPSATAERQVVHRGQIAESLRQMFGLDGHRVVQWSVAVDSGWFH